MPFFLLNSGSKENQINKHENILTLMMKNTQKYYKVRSIKYDVFERDFL